MGRGIAQVAALARLRRSRWSTRSATSPSAGAPRSASSSTSWSRRSKLDGRRARRRSLARIQPADLYGGDLEAVDFVVEAATENEELKREIFEALDQACRGGVDPGDQHVVDQHHRASARRSRGPSG